MTDCPDLYFETHGQDGPHVLLVHGMLSARSHWLPNLDALCRYARPVVVELYGHGRSPTPNDPNCYRPDQYVRQFELIRTALEADRWFVVGQSLGAALTLRYALDHPQRVIAQAFTNSSSAFQSPELRRALSPARPRHVPADAFADPRDHPMSPTRNRRLTPEVQRALEDDVALHNPLGLARTSEHTLPHTSLTERAGDIAVPTLLLAGVREQRFAERRGFIEATVPGLEVAELDAGHAANLDAAAAFDAALERFIRRFALD